SREDGGELLKGAAKKLGELTGVCDFAALSTIRELMVRTAESICAVPEAAVPEVLIRVMSLGNLVEQALRGLEVGMEVRWPLDTLADRMHLLLRGEVLHPELQGWHQGDAERLLELDRVSESFNNPPTPESSVAPRGSQFAPSVAWAHVFDRRSFGGDRRTGGDPVADRRGYGQATLRVPVSSVERMASMVADLVVTKNHILGVLERVSNDKLTPLDVELARAGSGDLARLTSGLDVTLTMMQVRLQNLGHLFDRFPRVIRDVASVADKNVELRTDAGSVQVDKGMFDALSDPIGQLLRAVVSRCIETPAERAAAGKPATAAIDLRAESKGTTVLITIAHDGRPTPRAEIIERAVELEMLSPELAASMSDAQVQALAFDEHYCDPDLAQIAAKVKAINGEIAVELSEGQSSYIIAAPLGVAVLDAVMVGVGGERYGIPLANVEEISQVCEGDVSTVRGRAVLRRRDGVVAIIDMRRAMGMHPEVQPERAGKRSGTAVVIKTQHHRAALLVTRVLANEELVVRSLGAEFASAKIFSGATISGDGKVNLIVDADRLAEHAHLESLRDE
ncbi:MAG: chemotaxis protein CheW, partial [Phycisphaerales bacterium]|nr:chemotaxis protein CheW [Phycisphaerales bacterium]